MRRTVVIAPCLLSEPDGESFLRHRLPALSLLAERGFLSKVAAIPPSDTPEALLLGLGPSDVRLAQGPLTVSALGYDPPEKSTHFHLSLASFVDGVVLDPGVMPLPGQVDALLDASKRLGTKLLTVLKGEEFDHGLVWEALGDMGTTPVRSTFGRPMQECLPEGDGESVLRRLIDDSVNLLSDHPVNLQRQDEGLTPFNLLWPWGHGIRTPVPNLALRRGEPAFVESSSMRLAGLVRLAGYRHIDRALFGRGLQTRLRSIAGRCLARDVSIVYVDSLDSFRREDKPEEIDWFIRELDRQLLQPLLDDQLKNTSVISLISPGPMEVSAYAESVKPSSVGLSVTCTSDRLGSNPYPFDERSLEERKVPATDVWTAVASALAP